MIRVLVCYAAPADPEAFDRHYFDVHVPLAQALPGLRDYTVSVGGIAPAGGPEGAPGPYLIASLAWDSEEALHSSLASPEGAAVSADLESFATAGWWMWTYEEQQAGARSAG